MSNLARAMMMGAAGASGDKVYVDDVFSTYLYEGTGTSLSINNGIDLAGEGGLVWIKRRDSPAADHALFDTNRGVDKVLFSNLTLESSDFANSLTQFNSSGFTVSSNSTVNASTPDHVSWTFRKAPGFFDVVTYTGNGVSGKSISHSLESVPGFIIIKNLDEANAWNCWHRGVTSPNSSWWQNYLTLNTGNAAGSWTTGLTAEPTSTSFTVGTGGGVNNSGVNYVAYVFAHDSQVFGTDSDEAIIKCGTYTGNGSTTGPVINLGFEPQWVMIKRTDASSTLWLMVDNMRGIVSGGNDPFLRANGADNEYTTLSWIDLTPTGFKLTDTSTSLNANGGTYIYMAIRRPHKPPTAGTEVFGAATQVPPSGNQGAHRSGFVADMAIRRRLLVTTNNFVSSRLLAGKQLSTNTTDAESAEVDNKYDYMNGYFAESDTSTDKIAWLFKRAPGFFDVVAYTGTGSSGANSGQQNITHNLQAVPELMFVKGRDYASDFTVYNATSGAATNMRLNRTNANISDTYCWDSTTPTSSVFRVGAALNGDTNVNTKTYIAYLFATLSGISKVGSYTGDAGYQEIDCGFTNGARFVLIKRTDASGDWYVFDTTRGINTGDDPYLLLNSTAAQVSNTDYLYPLNTGFKVNPVGLNASGGTYIFLAIA